jgi:general stress protein 26
MEDLKMEAYEKSLNVLNELFARDYQFALATTNNNIPSVRFIDTYYDQCCFYIVTYAKSKKVIEMEINNNVSLCNKLYSFNGVAINIGHPLIPQNSEIREKLIRVFEPWYFKHNNENDENMCYVKVELTDGFFYKDGKGFKVDFIAQEAKEFPFEFDMVLAE